MRNLRFAWPLLVALALTSTGAFAQRGVYENKRHGFALKPPKKWTVVPIKPGEEWVLAKFLSEKTYLHNDESGWTREHKPVLQVIGFPRVVETPNPDEKKKEDESGVEVIVIKNPYKNYVDYLDRHHQGGGWFFSEEERDVIDKVPVWKREIKVEKLTDLPRRIISYEFELSDGFYVVQVDVLESQYKKLRRGLHKTLATFRAIPKGPVSEPLPEAAGALNWVFGKNAAEIRKKIVERRRLWRERVLEEVKRNLPEDWETIETDNFLVVSHANPKFTKSLLEHAKKMRRWLDEEFADLGEGEVLKTVIRVCESSSEENAYRSGSGESFVWNSGEVICSQGDWALYEYGNISMALTRHYLAEKNPTFYDSLPWWYEMGLSNYVGSAVPSKKRDLNFREDTDYRVTLRALMKDDRLPQVDMLFTKTLDQMREDLGYDYMEIASFVNTFTRYLIEAPDKKVAFGRQYFTHLMTTLDEFEAKRSEEMAKKATERKKPMTEEEEDEWFRDANKRDEGWANAFESDRRAFLEQSYDAVFKDWKKKDWDKLQKEFERYLK